MSSSRRVAFRQQSLVCVSAILFLFLGGGGLLRSSGAQTITYDLVLSGGRVIDPATGLDAVRNLGISDGKVAEADEGRQLCRVWNQNGECWPVQVDTWRIHADRRGASSPGDEYRWRLGNIACQGPLPDSITPNTRLIIHNLKVGNEPDRPVGQHRKVKTQIAE